MAVKKPHQLRAQGPNRRAKPANHFSRPGQPPTPPPPTGRPSIRWGCFWFLVIVAGLVLVVATHRP